MNYELALELKNTGFPQTCLNAISNKTTAEKLDSFLKQEDIGYVDRPTLSELIEACVEYNHEMTFRLENIKDNVKWWSEMRHFGSLVCQSQGSTREEAVARLWLALNVDKS